MRVLCKIGRHAGEVREYPYHIAVDLIARGHAERLDGETETAALASPENAAIRTTAPPFKHVGGGWYELRSGRRVRGRKAAEQAANQGG